MTVVPTIIPLVATNSVGMMEDAKTPTFLGMTAEEWEALIYGVKDGFKFWKRTHIKYSDVDNLDISPSLKNSIKTEWHYYEIGSDLPEDVALLGLLAYFVITGQAEAQLGGLLKIAMTYFGMVV